MGPAAPRHVGPSQTRARTRVPRIGGRILNHCATREALCIVLRAMNSFLFRFPRHKLDSHGIWELPKLTEFPWGLHLKALSEYTCSVHELSLKSMTHGLFSRLSFSQKFVIPEPWLSRDFFFPHTAPQLITLLIMISGLACLFLQVFRILRTSLPMEMVSVMISLFTFGV